MVLPLPVFYSLLALIGSVTVGTVKTQPARVSPLPTTPEFSAKERECFKDKKVLYPQDGKCYDLRSAGPCRGENEWLVMDLAQAVNGTLKPICKQCPCCAASVRKFVFWAEDQSCHNRFTNKTRLCPYAGTDLENDPFGEGECVCTKDPPHLRHITEVQKGTNKFNYGPCYELYGKVGPCPRGQIFVSTLLPGFGRVGKCEVDKCARNNTNSNYTYAYHTENKECYKLNTNGPCSNLETFKVSSIFHQPQCLNPGNAIFSFADRCEVNGATNKCAVVLENKEEDQHSWVLDMWNKPCRKRSRNSVDVKAKCLRGKY